MSPHEQLGVTIREARLEKSMSLGQLASAVGRSSSSVRRWERGEVAPAASVVPKLAAVLEIDIESLRDDKSVRTVDADEESSQDKTHDKAQDKRTPTVEQPMAAGEESPPTTPQVGPAASSPVEGGVLSSFWVSFTKGGQGWMGWIRGVLTVAALIVMLFVLLWAVGELFSALGSVLDSFDVGSDGG
jgi:transcriptional regulator with XRE-family HTH domain